MNNFNYYTPTEVIFGKNTHKHVGHLINKYGGTKVLLHYGGNSAKKSGLLNSVKQGLEEAGISYVALGGVVPNPRLSKVREGIALCKQEGVDFILAVGGGSVIDSAKAIGYGIANNSFDVWQLFEKKEKALGCLPIGTVLTLAAAGSEMSNSCVITNEDGWVKRGYTSDYSRCKFAVLNPELTYTLPEYQTSCGIVDIMMHTMERYFAIEKPLRVTDAIAEGLLKSIIKTAPILMENPNNYEARAEIMWAGSLSHNGLTGAGGDGGDWATHQMEHELSGMFDVAHGAGLSAIWGTWARYVCDADPERFAKFSVNVMEIDPLENNLSYKGIEAVERFFRQINMPTNLKELGLNVSGEIARKLAYDCSYKNTRTIGKIKKINFEDIEKIYLMASGYKK